MKRYVFLYRTFLFLFVISFCALFFLEDPLNFGLRRIDDLSYFIPSDLLINDSWYGVYFGDKYIGYSHSFMNAQEAKKGAGYTLRSNASLEIPILGVMESLDLDTVLFLDKNYLLHKAKIHLASSKYFFKGTLTKESGNAFRLKAKSPANDIDKTIVLSDELISSSFAPMLMDYIPLKRKMSFSFFDPILQRSTSVLLKYQGKTVLTINGKKVKAVEYMLSVEGAQGRIVTDEKGYLLMQEFLGFTFVKEDASELFKKKTPSAAFDVIDRFTVSATPLPDTHTLSYCKMKIKGIGEDLLLEDFNQTVERENKIIEVSRQAPHVRENIPFDSMQFDEYLGEDSFITFRNNEIEEIAKRIIGNEKDAYRIVTLLSEWIGRHIKKIPTLSVPNSRDVLRLGQGDCGELSALFVGLLRSVGIPSYVNVGLVYQEERFFYHAWVSVFVGEWFDTDPALEELIADPTHIKLRKGLMGQFAIFRFIDKISIEILQYR